MAVRRCLYGDGRAAHLMYRVERRAVVAVHRPRPDAAGGGIVAVRPRSSGVDAGDRTYMLVARGGNRNGLARVASYLRNEAK